MHQDAFCTTNGGEGYPWWVAADFQSRAGCVCEQCCCCCCFSRCCCPCLPDSCRTPYISTVAHPLQPFFCLCNCLARLFDLNITTYDKDPSPWAPYSVGSGQNPAWMNVGNASMRQNNNDGAWSRLLTSAQVQNGVRRLYASKHNTEDRETFFDPFVTVVKQLWQNSRFTFQHFAILIRVRWFILYFCGERIPMFPGTCAVSGTSTTTSSRWSWWTSHRLRVCQISAMFCKSGERSCHSRSKSKQQPFNWKVKKRHVHDSFICASLGCNDVHWILIQHDTTYDSILKLKTMFTYHVITSDSFWWYIVPA